MQRKTCKGGGRRKGELERETNKEGEMQVFVGFYLSPSCEVSLSKYHNLLEIP